MTHSSRPSFEMYIFIPIGYQCGETPRYTAVRRWLIAVLCSVQARWIFLCCTVLGTGRICFPFFINALRLWLPYSIPRQGCRFVEIGFCRIFSCSKQVRPHRLEANQTFSPHHFSSTPLITAVSDLSKIKALPATVVQADLRTYGHHFFHDLSLSISRSW